LLKGALLGSSATFSAFDPAVRTAHSIELDHYRRTLF
jgi:hypothetical protein